MPDRAALDRARALLMDVVGRDPEGALARGLTLAELEREYINRVLQAEGGNKTRAAQRLGLDRKTLYRKLEEYGPRIIQTVRGVGYVFRPATAPAEAQ